MRSRATVQSPAGFWASASLATLTARISRALIGGQLYPRTAAEVAAGVTPADYAEAPGNVRRYGATGDGVTNETAAFTAARTVTGGRYHVPKGSYVVDAAPDVWADNFTADGGAGLIIGGVPKDVSNAFAGRLRYKVGSNELLWFTDARTGDDVIGIQNNAGGRATYFKRGLAFTNDSHFLQAQPATNGGSCDLLLQRSTLNADPAGNRFALTFDEANDRFIFTYATTASGAPLFDQWACVWGGTAPLLQFPALQAQFNQGWSVKQRAGGGFELEAVPTSTDVRFRNKGTPANICLILADNKLGFFGSSAKVRPTVTGSRAGNAALASLLTQLADLGLIVDGTSA